MAWYNPLSWPAAITATAYSGAGTVASWTGNKDYAEYLWSAGNPEYTPEVYRKALSSDANIRAAQGAEANRFTNRVVTEIAPNVETKAVGTIQAIGSVVPGGGVLSAIGAERIADEILKANGEAPMRSPIKLLSPLKEGDDYGTIGNFVVDDVLGIRGDNHYQSGGLPDAHPLSNYNPANHPVTVQNPSLWDKAKAGISSFFEMISGKTGLPFGLGSIIGALVGLVTMIATGPSLLGGALLVGGLFLGQTVANTIMPSGTTQPAPPAPVAAPTPSQPQTTTVATPTPVAPHTPTLQTAAQPTR